MEQRCGPLVFLSEFDSGNLARAEFVEPVDDPDSEAKSGKDDVPPKLVFDYEFNVWTKPDCMDTEFVNGNRTWFYFGVKAGPAGKVIRINVMNLNRQSRLYSQGMVPVVKVSYASRETSWERLRSRVTYQTVEGNFILSFTYKLPESRAAVVYFAFCFPFSYTECQALLSQLEEKHSAIPFVRPLEYMIYFHRELLCYSYEGLRVDLITITSCTGISRQREDRICGLFPDASVDRPHRFHGKKVYFLTARVHPGETPSSFVFNGFIDFILNERDPRAHLLRQLFVFKLIPMINPDGVYNGFYRTDTRGVNLNRVYLNPDRDLHPSVYAIKSLILYHHEKPDTIQLPEFGIANENCTRYSKLCVDNLALGFDEKNESVLKQLSGHRVGNTRPRSDADEANLRPSSEDACLSQPLNCEVENLHIYGDDEKCPKKDIVNSLKDSGSQICHNTRNGEIVNRRSNISFNLLSFEDSTEKAGEVNGELTRFSNPLQPEYSGNSLLRSSNIYSDVDSGTKVQPLKCGDEKLFITSLENSNSCNVTNGYLLNSTGKNHYFKQDAPPIDCSLRFPNVVSASGIGRLDSFAIGKPMEGRINCGSGNIFDSCNSIRLDKASSGCPVLENSSSQSVSESGCPDVGNALLGGRPVIREVVCPSNGKHQGDCDLETAFEHNKDLSLCEVSDNAYRCNESARELKGGEGNSLKIEGSSSLDCIDRGSGDFNSKSTNHVAKDSNVAYYIDLHGHASKRGCFIYANHMENFEDQTEALLFPKLMSINSQNFDFEACNFSLRNMTLKDKRDGLSKEGSGRVAIFRAIGLIHSYTLECNYNTGRLINSLPPAANSNGRATPPLLSSLPPKYTPEVYAQVGRALAISALDVLGVNPWSRIPASDFHSIKGIRQWLGVYIRSTQNPVPASKKIGRSKTKDDMQTKGNVVKKIEPLRNSRKSQTATDKKPISLTEHRMKDLSLELAISKNYSVPLIESKPSSDRKRIPKQTIELRVSRMESKTYQERKERNKSLPFLGLQQKPIEAVSAKEQTLTSSQSLLKKEMASKYRLKTMPKVVNRPVRKTFTKSMQTLENKDLKKKQVRCEKTKI